MRPPAPSYSGDDSSVIDSSWGPSSVPSHGVHGVGRGGSFKEIDLSRLSSAKPAKV